MELERHTLSPINLDLIRNQNVKYVFENAQTIPSIIFNLCHGDSLDFCRLAAREIFITDEKDKQIKIIKSKIESLEFLFYDGLFWYSFDKEIQQKKIIFNFFKFSTFDKILMNYFHLLLNRNGEYQKNRNWETVAIMWKDKTAIINIESLVKMSNDDNVISNDFAFLVATRNHVPLLDMWSSILKLHWLYGALESIEKNLTISNKSIMEKDDGLTIRKPYKNGVFAQKPIVLFFKKLREHKIISSDVNDTNCSNAIAGLTGFSQDKIRQHFSKINEKNFIENKDDLVKLRIKLSEIVKELEEIESEL